MDCLWVVGEPILVFKEALEKETGILTEADTYDWITFLPMSGGKDFEYPAFISQHLPNACG